MSRESIVSVTLKSEYCDVSEKEFSYYCGEERSLMCVADEIAEWIEECSVMLCPEPDDIQEALENLYLNGSSKMDTLDETEVLFRKV
ncbi:hypothetical protein CPT_Moabite_065 [Serratia phage Moabite]|uniref:Uncharacterized protein n=3 Tax=Moabitevirus TaxID=2843422 RepID=A0A7T3TLZ4_9CAUD|nr:hypothetical protein HWB23_gp340 [Serratia phage vB_SmaM_ 2050HW]YP_009849161.1 hypothetical protein HWC48_gp065 [Serratia phage Moabite]QPX76752.1 hypothetical protein [Serratia phage vB_SmaM_Yaphecito]UCR74605.1 hypothetical protein [Serratia phage BUCT660]UGO54281.1 hypothetical protein HAYMO_299 [Serratia phage vB_SmaM_Haymo]URG14172.1 hypothetical protein [Pectobacterium phage vB_ParM-25]ATA65675.1 hypothetical protein 2050HW_00340 [Serratia phage vB_SmaM_ 2050HW]